MEIKDKISPQGSVIEPVARDAGGVPIITPTSGYDGHYPVQFSDETDAMFAGRVAMFESSYANAVANVPGEDSLDARKSALKARYEADLASLEGVKPVKAVKAKKDE